MARKPRQNLDSNLILITQQSTELVFRNDEDRNYFLKLIEKAQRQYNCSMMAFCCAEAAAFQLVVDTQGASISKIMQSITIAYSMYRKNKDRLFEQRYKSIPIHSSDELNQIILDVSNKDPQFSGCCFVNDSNHPWMKSINISQTQFNLTKRTVSSGTYLEAWLKKHKLTFSELIKQKDLRNQAIFELRQHSDCTLARLAIAFDLSESNISKILKTFEAKVL
jgi:putative transposase